MEDCPEMASPNTHKRVQYCSKTANHHHCCCCCCCIVRVNSFMRFNSLGHSGEGETRQMEYKEDKSLNAVNVWGAPAIHPPSLLHSLSVWPYPTCMTPNHSSSLYPSITSVSSSFHFSAPRPELPSPVTDDTVWVDYLEYHEGYMVK